jgi:hypothetical protein
VPLERTGTVLAFTPASLTGVSEVGLSDAIDPRRCHALLFTVRNSSADLVTLAAIDFEGQHVSTDTLWRAVDNNFNGVLHDGGGIIANYLTDPGGSLWCLPRRSSEAGGTVGWPVPFKAHRLRMKLTRGTQTAGLAFTPVVTMYRYFTEAPSFL